MKINKKGFTLIELLVVIAIIGLLSTLAVVSLSSARTKARDARRMSDLKQISTALELYGAQDTTGQYPVEAAACADGIIANSGTGILCSGFAITDGTDTFLSAIPADPGTTNYEYVGDATTYCISANLETDDPGDFFKCSDGSCNGAAAGC